MFCVTLDITYHACEHGLLRHAHYTISYSVTTIM